MVRRLPPLVALRAFEAVGRTGSLRKAARDLGVGHTVVGRHIATLEEWLGCEVLLSDFRGVQLTARGAEFHRVVSSAFAMIEQGAENMQASQRGELRLWCAPGLAMTWLMPRLASMRTALGDANIVLSVRDDLTDFGTAQIDIAIHYGPYAAEGIRCEELAHPRMLPVASPEFVAAHPELKTAADLLKTSLLHERSTRPWEHWLKASGIDNPGTITGQRLHHAHIAMEAALLGEGVALVNWLLVRAHLNAGRLIEMVPSDIRLDGYLFCAPAEKWDDDLVTRMRDWLRAEMKDARA
ncbi:MULTISPECIES: LysR substrate-binding domain-containing protein [unclassified Achromobacter]|uniref:LysR substrate-binding domain-containing protein n=1 Tax=unclassified Achromobacter TaxID=2626865 RepID=UPI001303C791|nr:MULTISPECIES: LysR substrate-binding domain-containing protein [unclassified Achromobacter]